MIISTDVKFLRKFYIDPSFFFFFKLDVEGKFPNLLSFVCLFACFSGPHLQHTEVPRLGVESELQLPAYTTGTVRPDPSHVCDLHHSSWQPQILNSLIKTRD